MASRVEQAFTEGEIVGGILAVSGIALALKYMFGAPTALVSSGGGGGGSQLAPLGANEFMSNPIAPILEQPGVIALPIGHPFVVADPTVQYQGAGRNTYAYLQIKQQRNGQWITVYGSGVAGVFVGPSPSTYRIYPLVAGDQPQPGNYPAQSLVAFAWPGPQHTPISGAPPVKGPGSVYLEVYQLLDPARDGVDGFASPTLGPANGAGVPRIPVARTVYADKVIFQ